LDKLALKTLKEVLKIAIDLASYICAYRIFAVYEISTSKEITDNQMAGVSANNLFASHALVYEY